MGVKAVIGASVALLAVLVVFLLVGEEERRAGGNFTPALAPVVELRGADWYCQRGELVAADSAALRLLVGTHGRPTPKLSARLIGPEGEVISSGRLPAGRPQGHVAIPIERVERTTGGLNVCVATGSGGRTVLYGRGDDVRYDWMRPGSESRLAMLSTIGHRFGLAKLNPFGPWLLAAAALLLVLTCFLGLRLAVRELTK